MSLSAWVYASDDELIKSARLIAAARLAAPDLQLEIVAHDGEYLTVMIISGAVMDLTALLYVERHGAFEIVSVEPWPDTGPFLVLRPWREQEE